MNIFEVPQNLDALLHVSFNPLKDTIAVIVDRLSFLQQEIKRIRADMDSVDSDEEEQQRAR